MIPKVSSLRHCHALFSIQKENSEYLKLDIPNNNVLLLPESIHEIDSFGSALMLKLAYGIATKTGLT